MNLSDHNITGDAKQAPSESTMNAVARAMGMPEVEKQPSQMEKIFGMMKEANGRDLTEVMKEKATQGRKSIDVVPAEYPDPTASDLESPEFKAIWNVIKEWDINVPSWYDGYTGAMGNHVMAILNALKK